MRTYLYCAAFGLQGRFRKNRLFHEQQMTPGFLWTSLSPHSHTPHPSTVISAPSAPRCHLTAPANSNQALLALCASWLQARITPGSHPLSSGLSQRKAWKKRLKSPRQDSAEFSEIWLKLAIRFKVIKEGEKG